MNARRPSGVAWALSRVGAEVSHRFAARLGPLELTPSDAATLRVIGAGPASQREIGERLGLAPSRIVALIDTLETRGLVARTVDAEDRRRRVVDLTDAGREALAGLRGVAGAHDAEVVAGLTEAEVAQLRDLLARVSDNLGLGGGGHPRMR